jgi:hypothetical protein
MYAGRRLLAVTSVFQLPLSTAVRERNRFAVCLVNGLASALEVERW